VSERFKEETEKLKSSPESRYIKKYLRELSDWRLNAYSDAFRPLIPGDSGHVFRSIPAGHSD
jgi:hypothetical protein